MLKVLTKACRHPIDYSGICRTTDLTLINKNKELDDIYSFTFSAANLPTWKAGQHSIFTLPDNEVTGKTWRAFSVASAPHEEVIKISTHISNSPSSFKKNLLSLTTGSRVRMHGPFGEFHTLPQSQNIIGVAGGIGITPFRSIMSDLSNNPTDTKLTLIYSATEYRHCYKETLDEYCQKNENLNIIYVSTPEEVTNELNKQIEIHKKSARYFISGAPAMIEALRSHLLDNHVPNKCIVNDPFKGY